MENKNDVLKRLSEAFEKIDALTAQMQIMKYAHAHEVKILSGRIDKLGKENTLLRRENERLRGMINKNSGNSSKPPSSDGFVKNQNSRVKTGRKTGGQLGHEGHGPKLQDNPDEIVEIKAKRCGCGGRFVYGGEYKRKQLVDVEVVTRVLEYREFAGKCLYCGTASHNRAPLDSMVTYGDNLKSLVALLSVEGIISLNRLTKIVEEATGGRIALSQGTVVSWLNELAKRVAPRVETYKDNLLLSRVLNKDETGVSVQGKNQWFHVLSDERHTLYHVNAKRGKEADYAMGVLPDYSGTLMHDHWTSLYEFACTHAECNAHILRYLKAAIETQKRKWAQAMIELLLEAKSLSQPTPAQIADIQARYDEIIKDGIFEFNPDDDPDGEDRKLLRRMEKYKAEHLRFLTDPAVPFDNNQAERDLRMIKAKQKISGTFRAHNGADTFATLKSFTSTHKKQNLNIFDSLKLAFAI